MTAPMSVFSVLMLLGAMRLIGAILRPNVPERPQTVPYFDEAGNPIHVDGTPW